MLDFHLHPARASLLSFYVLTDNHLSLPHSPFNLSLSLNLCHVHVAMPLKPSGSLYSRFVVVPLPPSKLSSFEHWLLGNRLSTDRARARARQRWTSPQNPGPRASSSSWGQPWLAPWPLEPEIWGERGVNYQKKNVFNFLSVIFDVQGHPKSLLESNFICKSNANPIITGLSPWLLIHFVSVLWNFTLNYDFLQHSNTKINGLITTDQYIYIQKIWLGTRDRASKIYRSSIGIGHSNNSSFTLVKSTSTSQIFDAKSPWNTLPGTIELWSYKLRPTKRKYGKFSTTTLSMNLQRGRDYHCLPPALTDFIAQDIPRNDIDITEVLSSWIKISSGLLIALPWICH